MGKGGPELGVGAQLQVDGALELSCLLAQLFQHRAGYNGGGGGGGGGSCWW